MVVALVLVSVHLVEEEAVFSAEVLVAMGKQTRVTRSYLTIVLLLVVDLVASEEDLVASVASEEDLVASAV